MPIVRTDTLFSVAAHVIAMLLDEEKGGCGFVIIFRAHGSLSKFCLRLLQEPS
jgi:hypothetical protein